MLIIIALSLLSSLANSAVVRLATTTSTENSGLLEVLLPAFSLASGQQVQTIAVGTGKALKLGEMGDVDVVMVHAEEAEERFVAAGYGVARVEFMYNHFLVVGPREDPASIQSADSVQEAFAGIRHKDVLFLSRGDDSGTHKRELEIWQLAGITPRGSWYREAGQGMGRVLHIASELGAYTLSDSGTWLKLREQLALSSLLTETPPLYNPYSVIAVNPARHAHVNARGAQELIDWLLSERGQQTIDGYRILGQRAFNPLYPPTSPQ